MKYILLLLVSALGVCHEAEARIACELAEKGAVAKLEIKVADPNSPHQVIYSTTLTPPLGSSGSPRHQHLSH